ncbi:lipoprotein [Neisseria zalophi]|nr:lipoprotein [Neisseria zalophi]
MNRITFIFALLSAVILSGCGAKDTCLDQGGHYNETTKQCEK